MSPEEVFHLSFCIPIDFSVTFDTVVRMARCIYKGIREYNFHIVFQSLKIDFVLANGRDFSSYTALDSKMFLSCFYHAFNQSWATRHAHSLSQQCDNAGFTGFAL